MQENTDYFNQIYSSNSEENSDFFQFENTFYHILQSNNQNYLDSILENDSSFNETLDIAKAEVLIKEDRNIELPLYLKNFLEISQISQDKNDSLIIKLSKDGIRILGSFFENSNLLELNTAQASVRNSNHSQNTVLALEELKEGNIVYQLLKENDKEMYLSLKMDKTSKKSFDQIILKKGERIINSKSISDEGKVSFSGLNMGNYNIELIGKFNSKRFDLTICND